MDNSGHVINGAQTAWDMLHEEELLTRITTSCAELDNILGGGINCREVTEIGGMPGIGKTQLGIQLALNVQIPVDCGGLGGKAIYIDTEGSFLVERVLQMAEACAEDMSKTYIFSRDGIGAEKVVMEPKDLLENILHFSVSSYTEQIAVINYLDQFITKHRDVKILIIDSITFHFRQDFENLALRTRVLSGLALKLMKLAKKYCIAVVILNQVASKHTEGSVQLTLALGDSWSHACTNRIILYWRGDERYAHIDKSPSLRSASVPYAITSRGISSISSVPNCKRIKLM